MPAGRPTETPRPTSAGGGQLVAPGDVLAGRYHLLCALPVPTDAPTALWQARDDVLARPVAVKVLPARSPLSAGFLESAARAGAVEAEPLSRLYDAAVEPRRQQPSLAYVLSEWVPGEPLTAALTAGPLPTGQALDLAVQATQALVALHGGGAVHGRLHPGNVMLGEDGRLHLTDAEVAAALHDPDGPARTEVQRGDLRDLGALLYAMLTARWPDRTTHQPGRGLTPAPRRDAASSDAALTVCSPRQVLAGVPRPVDALVMRLLCPDPGLPPLDTAPAVLAELERVRGEVRRREHDRRSRTRRPGRLRRVAPWALAAAFLGVLGAVSYSLGLSLGELPAQSDPAAATPRPSAAAAPPPAGPVDLSRAVVRDFDPYGSPPNENADRVTLAYDGTASTAWTTELYRTPVFGGLKPGVGLLFDLGSPAAVSEVDLDLTRAGTGLELRAGDALGADQTSLPVVAGGGASDGGSDSVRLAVPPGTTARYWLVWLTRLPADGGQFRAGIAELRMARG